MSVLRKDPLSYGWVIYPEKPFVPPTPHQAKDAPADNEPCPFCPGNEFMTPPEISAFRPHNNPALAAWTVRTVPNLKAVLHIEGKANRRGEGLYDMMNGIGAHEVIIETPEHDARFFNYDQQKIEEVAAMWRDRATDLSKDSRFRYIQIFRNYGESAGGHLTHPHSQIIALPVVPRVVREEIVHAHEYWMNKERCILCDMLSQDRKSDRVIHENDYFVVIEPYASRSPFETWIVPREHASSFATDSIDLSSFAHALRLTLTSIAKALGNPSYNLIVHSAPTGIERLFKTPRVKISDLYHWHLEVVPRIKRIAGFEYGTGIFVNPVRPEDAAKYLREILGNENADESVL